MSYSNNPVRVTEVGAVWLDGFIQVHVGSSSDSFGRLALVQLAGELGVVFTAALVVLVLHHEHRVGGVDRQGEGQQHGDVPLVVVDPGRGVGREGAVQHKAGPRHLLGLLLLPQLGNDLQQGVVVIIIGLKTGGPTRLGLRAGGW